MTVLLGADPEVFVADIKTKSVVPSCGKFGGTKAKAVPFSKGSYGMYHWLEDNVTLELNFDPAGSPDGFVDQMREVEARLRDALAERGYVSRITPSVQFSMESLNTPGAKVFGCEPDFCAYDTDGGVTRASFLRQAQAQMGTNRYAGGHLHLTYANSESIPEYVVAQFMDVLVGLPAVRKDKQGTRRVYYGKAGSYRPRKGGVEYRTLSNFWFNTSTDEARQTVYDIARAAFSLGRAIEQGHPSLLALYKTLPLSRIQAVINSEDEGYARQIIEQVTRSEHFQAAGLFCRGFV